MKGTSQASIDRRTNTRYWRRALGSISSTRVVTQPPPIRNQARPRARPSTVRIDSSTGELATGVPGWASPATGPKGGAVHGAAPVGQAFWGGAGVGQAFGAGAGVGQAAGAGCTAAGAVGGAAVGAVHDWVPAAGTPHGVEA